MKKNLDTSCLRGGILLAALFVFSTSHAQIITTYAGNGTGVYGGDGGPATAAGLNDVYQIAIDGSGNIYLQDMNAQRIRKINPAGIITSIAGNGTAGYSGDGGPATAASLNNPQYITADTLGNVFIGDVNYTRIRRVDTSGIITTYVGTGVAGFSGDGGPATAAQINGAYGMTVDSLGNLYFEDHAAARIRKVSATGTITTIAGNGTPGYTGDGGQATAASIGATWGMCTDGAGNLYFTDIFHHVVRVISPSGIIHTFAGTGTMGFAGDGGAATAAQFHLPSAVMTDHHGNVYISDQNNNRVRKIDPSGIITTIAGTGVSGYGGDGGPATACEFSYTEGLAMDRYLNIYVSDWGNHAIRKITGMAATTKSNVATTASSRLSIFPNPCNGTFTTNLSSGIDEQVHIVITNVLGEKVKEFTTATNKATEVKLDGSAGVYFVSATDGEGKYFATVVIE